MMKKQEEYNRKIVGRSDQLSQELKEKITQENVLCAHAELSALVNATNYKNHHSHSEPVANKSTVLYETVDVIRYMIATLNTWGITSTEFETAFRKKIYILTSTTSFNKKNGMVTSLLLLWILMMYWLILEKDFLSG